MMTYHTKQRDTLLEKLQKMGQAPFTANDLLLKLMTSQKKVSKATVYRTLEKLVQDGLVRKYYIYPNESAFYQYLGDHQDCDNHFHCVCYECGRLYHVDCHVFDGLENHFNQEHNFKIDIQRTLLYGLCELCQ